MVLVPFLFVGAPVVIILLALPLIFGMVPRNRWYGFRSSKARHSDEMWYRANRLGGTYQAVAGLIELIGLGVIAVAVGDPSQAAWWALGDVLVPFFIAIILWRIHMRRY